MRGSLRVFPILLAVSSQEIACEWDSPTARLPGYSNQQAEERAAKLKSDWDAISHYQRTKVLIDEATTIYLARVTNVEHDKEKFRFSTTVEPLRAIKEKIPDGARTLHGFLPSSCGFANGDGDGVYTGKGDLVIVFGGVSKRDTRPNGIDSIRVSELRNVELLDEVQAWLNSLPGYEPYD